MSQWKTKLILNHEKGSEESGTIRIKRGIFQGDSLSPLLFCISLFPLSSIINKYNYGYDCQNKQFSHLLYMDDLKLFAKNDQHLHALLRIVKSFSDCIKMEFNADKCAKVTIKRGKYSSSENIELDPSTTIRELEQHDTYKYLGVAENTGISHQKMKETIRKEYTRRVRLIMRSQLNSKNKFTAINSLAVPVVTYSFPVVNWTSAEIKKLDVKTRKLLTIHRAHHPKADVDRLYIKRSEGGRGLLQIEMLHKSELIGMDEYFSKNKDWMIECVRSHDKNKKRYSISQKAREFTKDLRCDFDKNISSATMAAKAKKQSFKKIALKQLQENWTRKPLHGKFAQRSQAADINKDHTFMWLKSSSLKAETEGFIFAAQDQSLKTKNYIAKVMKTGSDPLCRYCGQFDETIDHLVSGCPILAKNEYIERHNKVGQYIHWKVSQWYGLPTADSWYKQQTPPVIENGRSKILWDFGIQTDRTILANRPDIIIVDKEKKTCMLLDFSVPSDRNTSIKNFEKISKYKDLEIEIQRAWRLKAKTVPIIIGALGVTNKSFPKYAKEIPGNISTAEIQKIALLGTARILRKALSLYEA